MVLEWITYALAVFFLGGWILGIRRSSVTVEGATKGVINTVGLWLIALGVVVVGEISPFHLLWVYPLCMLIPMLFPSSLLPIVGTSVAALALVGLNREMIVARREQYEKVQDLMLDGMSAEQSKQHLMEIGEWYG